MSHHQESDITEFEDDLETGVERVGGKTTKSRLTATAVAAGLFALVSSPMMYQGLQSIFGQAGISIVRGGVPTALGVITTGIIYTLVTRLAMGYAPGSTKRHDPNGFGPSGKDGAEKHPSSKTSKDLWVASVMGGVLYVVVSNPYLYQLTNQLTTALGVQTSSGGMPNGLGLGLHTLVFGGAVYFAMDKA